MDSVKPMSRTRVLLLLALVVAGGGVLRSWRLGAKSAWLDEGATLKIAERPFLDTTDSSGAVRKGLFTAVATRDTHPPLYYSLLHLWMGGTDGVVRARAFSAVAGTASLLLLFLLARISLPPSGALAATLLLASSAYQVYFGQEARHYVLAAFWVLLGFYLLALLLVGKRERQWPLWLALALTNGAAMYTFYYTAFAIVAQSVLVALHVRENGKRLFVRWCVWQALPAALFCAWLPVVMERYVSLQKIVWPGTYTVGMGDLWATAAQFASGFVAELAGGRAGAVRVVGGCLGMALLLLGLMGLRRCRGVTVMALVWLFLPLGIVVIFPFKGHVYEAKHLIFAAPALALLGGIAVSASRGRLRAVVAVVVVLTVGWNGVSLVGGSALGMPWLRGYYDRTVEKENWRDVASRVAQFAEEGDVIVLNPAYGEIIFTYYYRPERLGRPCPKLDPQRGVDSAKLGRRTWLLTSVSNVEQPKPAIERAFAKHPVAVHEEYHDLVGSIVMKLLLPPPGNRAEPQAPPVP